MCGTEIAVQNIQTYNGRFVCRKCYNEQLELEKTTAARIGRVNNAFKGQDVKRLVPLLAIMGILVLIILFQTFKKMLFH